MKSYKVVGTIMFKKVKLVVMVGYGSVRISAKELKNFLSGMNSVVENVPGS